VYDVCLTASGPSPLATRSSRFSCAFFRFSTFSPCVCKAIPVVNASGKWQFKWQIRVARFKSRESNRRGPSQLHLGPGGAAVGCGRPVAAESSRSLTWTYSEHMMMAIETHVFHLVPALSHSQIEPQLVLVSLGSCFVIKE
jgi:hypothetical protein